jgi:hypothetical protein
VRTFATIAQPTCTRRIAARAGRVPAVTVVAP